MNTTNKLMIKSAFQIAEKTHAKAVLIYIDPLDDLKYEERYPKKSDVILVSKKKKWDFDIEDKTSLGSHAKTLITVPKSTLTRMALVKLAVMLGMSLEQIEAGSKVVCVVGHAENGILDSIQVIDTSKDSEILTGKNITKITENVSPEVFQSILNLSIDLADKGREGKPVGTIFVVGDEEHVMQLSRQMIINPFKGYEDEERNILNPSLKETIREFAAMDGAFIVSGDGIVLTAGRYLSAASDDANLPRGLGARHLAAAGITALTKSVAFVISESSGDVKIFKDGKIIMNVEKAPTKR
ncbi:MAG: DNA integrity scanning protein DisA nucleotide-binding domain protein [Deltaproteobacteria bacterium]|nr:DNA integrity scanning protein DisA nucleotide-binding domain protein [Deltaproteobacteria bacterium]